MDRGEYKSDLIGADDSDDYGRSEDPSRDRDVGKSGSAPQITFDDHGKVRVLEQDVYDKTQKMHQESSQFGRKIADFGSKVNNVVQVLENYANRIEKEKMKAIGIRMAYDSAQTQLKSEEKVFREAVAQEKAKLEKLTEEYESLCKAKLDQQAFIDKLAYNDF